jgi:hypothetical protein
MDRLGCRGHVLLTSAWCTVQGSSDVEEVLSHVLSQLGLLWASGVLVHGTAEPGMGAARPWALGPDRLCYKGNDIRNQLYPNERRPHTRWAGAGVRPLAPSYSMARVELWTKGEAAESTMEYARRGGGCSRRALA